MSPKISCQQSTHTRNQISNESIFSNQRFNNLALLIKVVRVQVVNATVPYRWTEHDAIWLLVIKIQFKGSDEQSSDSSSSIRKYNLPSPIWYWRAPRPAPPPCLRRDGDLVIDALVLENMAKKNHKQNWILGRTGLSNVQYKSTFYKRILFDFLPDKSFILALIRLW